MSREDEVKEATALILADLLAELDAGNITWDRYRELTDTQMPQLVAEAMEEL